MIVMCCILSSASFSIIFDKFLDFCSFRIYEYSPVRFLIKGAGETNAAVRIRNKPILLKLVNFPRLRVGFMFFVNQLI